MGPYVDCEAGAVDRLRELCTRASWSQADLATENKVRALTTDAS